MFAFSFCVHFYIMYKILDKMIRIMAKLTILVYFNRNQIHFLRHIIIAVKHYYSHNLIEIMIIKIIY